MTYKIRTIETAWGRTFWEVLNENGVKYGRFDDETKAVAHKKELENNG